MRKFADEEHLRRYVRGGVQDASARLVGALSHLENGDLELAADAFDSVGGEAADLSRVLLDWPDNLASTQPNEEPSGTEGER